MKPRFNPFLRCVSLATSIALTLGHVASAADYYWDANGTTSGTGGAGNWNTANANSPWRNGSSTGTLGAWADGNTAVLGGTAGAVTISSGTIITLPKINVTTTNYSLSGGTVAFGGSASSPGIIDVNATSGFTFSSNATGSLKLMATGSSISLASAAPMIITGSTNLTSFELAMNQDQNHLILGNAAALGTASSAVKLTKGTLNLGNTAGVSLSYNSWATDLAGGTIRGRFSVQTWNGATSLSANSMLMTRNAGDAKLVFSSTGTINLGGNSLTLMSSSGSLGIELNGVISGTGNLVTGSNALGGTDNGNGTTTLNAVNTFTGTATTTQNIGTLALGNVDALKDATLNTGLTGTQAVTFVVAGTNTYNIGALTGSDALAIGANTISLGNKAGTSSFGADISGAGGLTKTGASSTQVLTAATSYSGATQITGGTLSLTGSGAVNSSSGITINGSGAKLLHTASSAISPVVTLTQGTLTGSGTVNTVNVGAGTGGIISNNNGVAGAALTIGNLTLSGAADIILHSNSTAAALNISTGLTTASTAATITANNAGGWTNGSTYTLISYGGGSIGGSGNNFAHVVNNLSARQSATWGDTGAAIQITVNGDTPYWTGAANNLWNTGATNWKLISAGTDTQFLANDDVLFDDNATGSTTIDINAASVTPNSTQFNNASQSYTLGSSGGFGIASGSLTKNGTGALNISSNNTYSGPTNLNAGTVTMSGSGTLGSSSALTLNGAKLDLGGSTQSVGTASITASAASGNTIENGSLSATSFSVNSSANIAINAALLNAGGGLSKSGTGTLTLSGVNTWTGTTTVSDGALVLSGAGTLGNNAALSLAGGSLDLGTSSQTIGALSITSAAASGDTISNGSLTGTSYSASLSSGNAVVSSSLLANGAAGFSMSGAGTVTLSGTNTYTGATSVSAGTLKAGSSNAFTNKGALALSGSAIFDLAGNNASFTNLSTTAGNTITTSGSGTGTDTLTITGMTAASGGLFTDGSTRKLAISIDGTPTLDPLTNAGNTFSGGLSLLNMRLSAVDNSASTGGRYGKGTITIGTGSQIYFNNANRTISNDIVVNANSNVGSRTGAFRVDTSGHILSGTITAGAADAMFNPGGGGGGLTITGKVTGNSGLQVRNTNGTSMTLTLNTVPGNNDYLGLTVVGETTAKLILGAADQIPNGMGKGNVSLTGTLDLGGFSETINGLSGAGTLEGATTGTPSNTLTLGDGDASGLTFSGVIQNTAGSLSLTKTGTGTQILSGANTYTGATLISGGTLQIGAGGGTGSLSPSSTITNNGTLAFNRTGTVTQGTDFASGISGSGNLATSGSGTVILSGTNNYAGTTTVSTGELRLTSATAINGTSGITVSSGRMTLDGSITIGSGKSVTINGSGGNFFGSLQGNSGTNEWAGGVVVGTTAGTRIGVNSGQLTVSGVISGSTAGNGLMLRPNNGTTLVVSASNTYLGDTAIISGTGEVKLAGGSNRLPTGTKLNFGGSGVSGILNLNGQNQEVAGLSVASGTANEIKSATAATLTVNTASASPSTYSGIISGATSLTKTGADSLTLTNLNSYTGATTISQGSLVIGTGGGIANSSTIHIAGGATLDVSTAGISIGAAQTITGTGTILATGNTVTASGTLSPGNSPGTLVQDGGTLQLGADGDLNWQVYDASGAAGSGYDTISLTNGATLDLSLLSNITPYNINLWSLSGISPDANGAAINFDNTLDYTWTLFSTDNAIAGFDPSYFSIFTGSNNGTSGFANGLGIGSFSLALSDSDTDLVLKFTAIPEPNVAALLGGLGTLALMRRRRVS